MSFWRAAFRPLRQFADFRGRSTRTEVFAFGVLAGLLGIFLDIAGILAGFVGRGFHAPLSLFLLCPTLALAVRRAHDSGHSGRWLLLGLPGAAISLRREFLLWQHPFDFSHLYLPAYVELPAALLALPIFGLLLAGDEEGPNAYGPNPRYPDDVALSEQPGEPA